MRFACPDRKITGGSPFRSQVDQIEVAVMPVLLGGGTLLVSAGTPRSGLILTRSNTSLSGIVNLQYQVRHAPG